MQTPRSGRKTQTQRKLTYAVGAFRFDSVLPTERGIFVPVQRSESNSGNNKREPRSWSHAGTPDATAHNLTRRITNLKNPALRSKRQTN